MTIKLPSLQEVREKFAEPIPEIERVHKFLETFDPRSVSYEDAGAIITNMANVMTTLHLAQLQMVNWLDEAILASMEPAEALDLLGDIGLVDQLRGILERIAADRISSN